MWGPLGLVPQERVGPYAHFSRADQTGLISGSPIVDLPRKMLTFREYFRGVETAIGRSNEDRQNFMRDSPKRY